MSGIVEVSVRSMGGEVVAEVVLHAEEGNHLLWLNVKRRIEAEEGTPVALQKLVLADGRVLSNHDVLDTERMEVLLVRDESALWAWDIAGNPHPELLIGSGNVVEYTVSWPDYCNVITQEPVRHGLHYFEFVMHAVGDEQWCGVTNCPELAGTRFSGRSLRAWTYYCGRRRGGGTTSDGIAALHADRHPVTAFAPVQSGTVIGMLVDADRGCLAFANDGQPMGACVIPLEPLYVLTHLDEIRDKVELRKPPVQEAPAGLAELLKSQFR